MRRHLFVVTSLTLAIVGCGKADKKRTEVTASAVASAATPPPRGEPPQGWTLWAPGGGGYSVFMPGTPEKLDTGLSELHAVKRPSGSAYMAMCMVSEAPSEALKGMRRGKIGERKLLSATPVDDGRGKGERLAIELETDKGMLISNELLLMSKSRVCSFSVLVPASADEKADIDRFFDSARIDD